ncbi:MAG TPA: hypothetical protein VMU60_13135 [Syntrophobacteria bacterium]|nr:hypothetical protein [Syntrophobacteria bacterium]
MKVFLVTFALLGLFSSAHAGAPARELAVDEYAGSLRECHLALYAITQFLIVEGDKANPGELKALAPELTRRVKRFDDTVRVLQKVTPKDLRLQPLSRVFVRQYENLALWSKDLARSLDSGDQAAVLHGVASGSYLLRDLRSSWSVLEENLGKGSE